VDRPPGLGSAAIRRLAARHGIRPRKAFGQHFLVDPNLARAIAADAGVGPRDRVVEIGAGFGSLSVALAATGAEVLAVEFDRALLPALDETVGGLERVRVLVADALHVDWSRELARGRWTACANLPYNIAVPVVLRLLEEVPSVTRFVVMVQREVGQRFVAGPGDLHYGPTSLRVAYLARGELVRRVPPNVFWPRPRVESVVVRLHRLDRPRVAVDVKRLWRVVDTGFAERRKAMRAALVRMGVEPGRAQELLEACGIEPRVRAQRLSLEEFACLAGTLP
jgi:16S rRNA (adenine1518-N6/adenine1519-N6)-dimethyltransferase